MRKLASLAGVTLFVCFGVVSSVAAQQAPCGRRAALLDLLRVHFSETPVAIALDAEGRAVEILASPVGTWTILLTIPGGPTCMITSGRDWQPLVPAVSTPVT